MNKHLLPRGFREPSESSGIVDGEPKNKLTPSFRGPSESSAPSKKLASVELPWIFRVKHHREPHTKKVCLRRTPARFRVKRLLPLCVCLCSPPLSTAAGCHFIAKTILAYETLTRTLRTASAQIPRNFPMFLACLCLFSESESLHLAYWVISLASGASVASMASTASMTSVASMASTASFH